MDADAPIYLKGWKVTDTQSGNRNVVSSANQFLRQGPYVSLNPPNKGSVEVAQEQDTRAILRSGNRERISSMNRIAHAAGLNLARRLRSHRTWMAATTVPSSCAMSHPMPTPTMPKWGSRIHANTRKIGRAS